MLIIGLWWGYAWGWKDAIRWISNTIVSNIDLTGINLGNITSYELQEAIFKYRYHIDSGT